jgi:hypothetical protein
VKKLRARRPRTVLAAAAIGEKICGDTGLTASGQM